MNKKKEIEVISKRKKRIGEPEKVCLEEKNYEYEFVFDRKGIFFFMDPTHLLKPWYEDPYWKKVSKLQSLGQHLIFLFEGIRKGNDIDFIPHGCAFVFAYGKALTSYHNIETFTDRIYYVSKVQQSLGLLQREDFKECRFVGPNPLRKETYPLIDPLTGSPWPYEQDWAILEIQRQGDNIFPIPIQKHAPTVRNGDEIFLICSMGPPDEKHIQKSYPSHVYPRTISINDIQYLFRNLFYNTVMIRGELLMDATEEPIVRYAANVLPGASGSFVVTSNGELIGMHLGGCGPERKVVKEENNCIQQLPIQDEEERKILFHQMNANCFLNFYFPSLQNDLIHLY